MAFNNHARRWGRRQLRIAFALVTAAVGAAVLHPAPARAAGEEPKYTYVIPTTCEEWDRGTYRCVNYGEMWQTNGTEDTLGTRGVFHTLGVKYSPNNSIRKSETDVYAYSSVWDRSGAQWQRMYLQQTFKVLDTAGTSLSVNWGVGGVETTDPTTVSATTVQLSMTRQAPLDNDHMSRSSSITFPRHWRQFKVEHASTSTIEYAQTNRDYRLVTQLQVF